MSVSYPRLRYDLHGMHTPWGRTDAPPDEVAPGVLLVQTPSHGGVMVAIPEGAALFPAPVLAVGRRSEYHTGIVRHRGIAYIPFEEDCEMTALIWSCPTYFIATFGHGRSLDAFRAEVRGYIERHYPHLLDTPAVSA